MANEITIQSRLKVSKGFLSIDQNTGSLSRTMTGLGAHVPVVVVNTTAEEDLPTGDIVTKGWLYFRNLSTLGSSAYVTWGPKSTAGTMVSLGKMVGGDCAGPFRMDSGATIRWRATTAAAKIQVTLLED